MAGEGNLRPCRSKAEARERGTKGGKASGEARREKANLRKLLEIALQMQHEAGGTNAEVMTLAILKKALSGDVKAFETIRDTIGQKPVEKAQIESDGKLEIVWQK